MYCHDTHLIHNWEMSNRLTHTDIPCAFAMQELVVFDTRCLYSSPIATKNISEVLRVAQKDLEPSRATEVCRVTQLWHLYLALNPGWEGINIMSHRER